MAVGLNRSKKIMVRQMPFDTAVCAARTMEDYQFAWESGKSLFCLEKRQPGRGLFSPWGRDVLAGGGESDTSAGGDHTDDVDGQG